MNTNGKLLIHWEKKYVIEEIENQLFIFYVFKINMFLVINPLWLKFHQNMLKNIEILHPQVLEFFCLFFLLLCIFIVEITHVMFFTMYKLRDEWQKVKNLNEFMSNIDLILKREFYWQLKNEGKMSLNINEIFSSGLSWKKLCSM